MYLGECLHLRTQVNKDAHHFHKTSRNEVRENISCVHIPVFLLASKTTITFYKVVVAAAQTTPTGR
jgi:hypothetical protein